MAYLADRAAVLTSRDEQVEVVLIALEVAKALAAARGAQPRVFVVDAEVVAVLRVLEQRIEADAVGRVGDVRPVDASEDAEYLLGRHDAADEDLAPVGSGAEEGIVPGSVLVQLEERADVEALLRVPADRGNPGDVAVLALVDEQLVGDVGAVAQEVGALDLGRQRVGIGLGAGE
jgi:hypothetical protein